MLRWPRPLGPGLLVLALLLGLGTACGPVVSLTTLNDAETALERARLDGAERFAVYEYVSAVEYFAKAREEWGYSDYQHAAEYASRALEFAEAARERALASPERPRSGRPQVGDTDDR